MLKQLEKLGFTVTEKNNYVELYLGDTFIATINLNNKHCIDIAESVEYEMLDDEIKDEIDQLVLKEIRK